MEYLDYMYEYYQEQKRIDIEEAGIKKEFKSKLKGLINITGLFRYMDEFHDSWLPLDIVDIEKTGEIKSGYPKTETCRIVNDECRHLYLYNTPEENIRGVKHYFVWQTGHDDSYNGYLLYPLKDGRYFKVNYSC